MTDQEYIKLILDIKKDRELQKRINLFKNIGKNIPYAQSIIISLSKNIV